MTEWQLLRYCRYGLGILTGPGAGKAWAWLRLGVPESKCGAWASIHKELCIRKKT